MNETDVLIGVATKWGGGVARVLVKKITEVGEQKKNSSKPQFKEEIYFQIDPYELRKKIFNGFSNFWVVFTSTCLEKTQFK